MEMVIIINYFIFSLSHEIKLKYNLSHEIKLKYNLSHEIKLKYNLSHEIKLKYSLELFFFSRDDLLKRIINNGTFFSRDTCVSF